jgi:hypothetical protein
MPDAFNVDEFMHCKNKMPEDMLIIGVVEMAPLSEELYSK